MIAYFDGSCDDALSLYLQARECGERRGTVAAGARAGAPGIRGRWRAYAIDGCMDGLAGNAPSPYTPRVSR
jgi:hypothetical protein